MSSNKQCEIKGCNNKTNINPETNTPFKVCKSCLDYGKNVPKKDKVKVTTFILRKNRLRINYSHTTHILPVDSKTRAVIYNDSRKSTTGQIMKYIIEIKTTNKNEVVLFDTKEERDTEYKKLQKILNRL